MFNLGFPELLVIFGVALLALGPEKLPELARMLGKLTADLRRQSDGLRREFFNEVYKPAKDQTNKLKDASKEISNIGKEILDDVNNIPCPPELLKEKEKNSDV